MLGLARAGLAALLLVAAGAWVGALLASSSPSPPSLLVYGEPEARRGALWPVRVVAVWPSERRRAPFEGVVVTPAARVPIDEDGVARVPLPAAGDEVLLGVEGRAAGVVTTTAVTVRLVGKLPARPPPRFVPWTAELASGTAKDRAGPPLYPVAGRQPSTLSGEIIVVTEAGLERVELAPNAARVESPDGRPLQLDRTGVVVKVPPVAAPAADLNVTLRSSSAERLHVDLVVNGRVHDMRVVDVTKGETALRLRLPAQAGEGWYAVHAAPSPLGAARGAVSVGLLSDAASEPTPADVVSRLARHPSFRNAGDPLLARLTTAPPEDMTPVRAVLARLHVDDVRPANLAPTSTMQLKTARAERQRAVWRFRVPFRVAGGLFAVLAAIVALVSGASSRWRQESGDESRRPLGPWVWAALAFTASLAALWVLDWAIGFMLYGRVS